MIQEKQTTKLKDGRQNERGKSGRKGQLIIKGYKEAEEDGNWKERANDMKEMIGDTWKMNEIQRLHRKGNIAESDRRIKREKTSNRQKCMEDGRDK